MKIKGTIQNIDVTVNEKDALNGLIEHFELYHVFHPHSDIRYMLRKVNNKQVLIEEEDISRHGSECWMERQAVIKEDETEKMEIYLALKTLYQKLK